MRESNFLIANFLNYKIYLNKFYANDNNLTIKLISDIKIFSRIKLLKYRNGIFSGDEFSFHAILTVLYKNIISFHFEENFEDGIFRFV